MKMNKKGFTLIEMLVVIAIIAVLVAIVIPTVTSATTKAAAATNAANLRSYQAELSLDLLDNGTIDGTITAPKSKKCGTYIAAGVSAAYTNTNGVITVNFGDGKTIDYFATIAETGSAPTT